MSKDLLFVWIDSQSEHRDHVEKDLIDIEENKTGQSYSKEISPRLRKALQMASKLETSEGEFTDAPVVYFLRDQA